VHCRPLCRYPIGTADEASLLTGLSAGGREARANIPMAPSMGSWRRDCAPLPTFIADLVVQPMCRAAGRGIDDSEA
jgi:hypothetical protein